MDDPWDFLDAAPAIPPPLPLTETETEDEPISVKSAPAPSSAPWVSAKCKPTIAKTKDILDDVCPLQKAICMYPADEDSIKETGILTALLIKWEHQMMHTGTSVYLCPHEKCQVPSFYAQGPAALY